MHYLYVIASFFLKSAKSIVPHSSSLVASHLHYFLGCISSKSVFLTHTYTHTSMIVYLMLYTYIQYIEIDLTIE